MGALGLEGRISNSEQRELRKKEESYRKEGGKRQRREAGRRKQVKQHLDSLSKATLVTFLMTEYDTQRNPDEENEGELLLNYLFRKGFTSLFDN